jgi:carbamoyltransferase
VNILGISAFYHDAAAALLRDGEVVAAAQEERFTRKKHDASFPVNAIRYVLAEAGISVGEIDAVAFYEKPITKFVRILETYFSVAPKGLRSFMMAMPVWLKQKLWIPLEIERSLEACGASTRIPIYFSSHHESHAASAFFPSPFERSAVLTIDGVGERESATIGHGEGNRIELISDLRFPHSLGLLYSAFTYFCGFRVNSGEYKLMGLAPYGKPTYVQTIYENLVDVRDDGSFRLNMDYFGYLDGLKMTNRRFAQLFGGPERRAESEITQREMDMAKSIQVVTEDIVLKMAQHARQVTSSPNLCLSGGVALNCVANGKLLSSGCFEKLWIQPASGDAGGALGAAWVVWHHVMDSPRTTDAGSDSMRGSYLGPGFDDAEIHDWLVFRGCSFRRLAQDGRADVIAGLIEDEKVVGLCQGRMEYGPRALGNRSIIGDARSSRMQAIMNLKIKHRESFRPFAPSCLEEQVSDFFELDEPSPYMLLVAPVKSSRCCAIDAAASTTTRERINQVRSDVPAITHVDFSARVQTVNAKSNPEYYDIIRAFEKRTGYGIIINTSFNVRGEPIVCTPEDAYRCFMRTEMDCLVLGSYLLMKVDQPEWKESVDWETEFVLD